MRRFSRKIDVEAVIRRGLYQELILVMAFIEQQDYQTDTYVSEFSEKLLSGGQGIKVSKYIDLVSVSNVSSDEYDLEDTFKQGLPNYIRKSQLLMLWSMLEDTLKVIIEKLSINKNIQFRKKARQNESIFHYYIYKMETINGDNEHTLSSINSVSFLDDNVREIRNSLVHGRLPKVSHDEIEVMETDILISGKYIREVCMSINELAMCL